MIKLMTLAAVRAVDEVLAEPPRVTPVEHLAAPSHIAHAHQVILDDLGEDLQAQRTTDDGSLRVVVGPVVLVDPPQRLVLVGELEEGTLAVTVVLHEKASFEDGAHQPLLPPRASHVQIAQPLHHKDGRIAHYRIEEPPLWLSGRHRLFPLFTRLELVPRVRTFFAEHVEPCFSLK